MTSRCGLVASALLGLWAARAQAWHSALYPTNWQAPANWLDTARYAMPAPERPTAPAARTRPGRNDWSCVSDIAAHLNLSHPWFRCIPRKRGYLCFWILSFGFFSP